MTDYKKIISDNIFHYMKLRGIKSKDLAAAIGVNPSAISHWRKSNSIDLQTFFNVCDALGCTADELAGRNSGVYLSVEEREILDAYNNADEEGRSYVRGALRLPENRGVGEERKRA